MNTLAHGPLYGYRKDPENCHKLLIDPEAAEVVFQIFQWAYEHVGLNDIARRLNEQGIQTPSHRKRATGEITHENLVGSGKWQTRTVARYWTVKFIPVIWCRARQK